ncbi:trypsin-like peptidase domain-containing protein [Nocardioides sp.]|uniref:S1C family serine protease n=1 Tax=Nocardioides sp. TaxID=35761 RepID=UPI003528172F
MTDRTPEPDGSPWADGETEPTQPLRGPSDDPWAPRAPSVVPGEQAAATSSDAAPSEGGDPLGAPAWPMPEVAPIPSATALGEPAVESPAGGGSDVGAPIIHEPDPSQAVGPAEPAPDEPWADPPVAPGPPVAEPWTAPSADPWVAGAPTGGPVGPMPPDPQWGPSAGVHTGPMQTPVGQPAWPATGVLPAAPSRPPAGRVPVWLWPAVAVLALMLGLFGGAVGGAAYDRLTASGTDSEVTSTDPAPLPADNGSVAAVADAVLPSTVQIIATQGDSESGATGSGFVLDRRGHVVTNNHVVADAAGDDGRILIVDQNGNRYDATLVGRSPVYDLAVLYAPEVRDIAPASLGAAQQLRVGDGVVAIGSPLGLTSTVTAGIVSAVDRPVTTGSSADDTSYINAVQTDAAINPGNSGGPLVNLAGQVVGVNSAIATTGGLSGEAGNIGVGFAIPIEQVRTTTKQILRDGEASYPVIGATVQTATSVVDAPEGATVEEVLDGSPAEQAGLRADDVVTAIDGHRVTDGIALIVAIRAHQPGETVALTVQRDGREQTVEVTLDSKVG